MNRTGSWWKRTWILLCAILVLTLLFFVWTSYNVSWQIGATVKESNSASVSMWSADMESRTTAIYEHVYELLVTLHNANQLRSGSPEMDNKTKRKLVDMMEEKLIVSADADAFFVYDSEQDFYLYSARQALGGREILALKGYLQENHWEQETAFHDRSWKLLSVGSVIYLEKGVRLGKYLVGAVSRLDHYPLDSRFAIQGDNAVLTLKTGTQEFICSGTPDSQRLRRTDAVSCRVEFLNAEAELTVTKTLFRQNNVILPILLFLDSALCVVLVVILLRLLRRRVAIPGRQLRQANETLAGGDLSYRLDTAQAGSREYEALFESFNEMAAQITQLRIEAYDLRLQEDANRLTMLRAQIRPHSFLNAITTISNMTYFNEPEEIRAYIAAFAKFIRYMLNVNNPWITVSGEIDHIRNYLTMQERRFPGCIRFEVECDEEAKLHEIPFLMLYTLVENSIKHAMTLYEQLDIRLRCRRLDTGDFHGVCLTEEDSGEGFSEEALHKLFAEDAVYTKEHLGLSNVRYTLNLLYHRNDLLTISNFPEGGARVEIRIPDREEHHEAFNM